MLARMPLALVTIAVVMLAAVACGRSDSSDTTPTIAVTVVPTPTPTPVNPEAALKRSGEVMRSMKAFHFRIHHESGGLELLPGMVIDEVKGDVIKPDKLSITFSGSVGSGFAIKASLITLGDESYMTGPLTGEWTAGPTGVSALGFFDPSRGIEEMMSQVEQATLVSDDSDKSRVYRIGGNLAAEALGPLVGKTVEGSTVRVELTIDSEHFYLLESRFAGQVTPTDADDAVRIITLSAFNEPISIEAPR